MAHHQLHCNANRDKAVGCAECSCVAGMEIKRLQAALSAERDRCARLVPTNWCDPLLTGKDASQPPLGNRAVEALLRGIQDRIRGSHEQPEKDACATCGQPRNEHSYNGACYWVCGEFKAQS